MNIIDHLSVGVPSIEAGVEFYNAVLETIGVANLAQTEAFVAYGNGAVQFLLMKPENGEEFTAGNGTHICFKAESKEAVDAFHKTAMDKGGQCAGEPGPRPAYPKEGVYTGFVKDPFGHKLEVIFNGFA